MTTQPTAPMDYRAEANAIFEALKLSIDLGENCEVNIITNSLRSFASRIERETKEKIAGHFKAESDMAFSLSNGAKRIAHLDRTQDERESTERLIKSERAKAILNRDIENTIRNLSLPPTTGE